VFPIASFTGTVLLLAIQGLEPLRINGDTNRLGGRDSVSPVEPNVDLLDIPTVKGRFPCLLFQIILVCDNNASARMVQHHRVVSVDCGIFGARVRYPKNRYSCRDVDDGLGAQPLEDATSRHSCSLFLQRRALSEVVHASHRTKPDEA
jgi:hypothetical protein